MFQKCSKNVPKMFPKLHLYINLLIIFNFNLAVTISVSLIVNFQSVYILHSVLIENPWSLTFSLYISYIQSDPAGCSGPKRVYAQFGAWMRRGGARNWGVEPMKAAWPVGMLLCEFTPVLIERSLLRRDSGWGSSRHLLGIFLTAASRGNTDHSSSLL